MKKSSQFILLLACSIIFLISFAFFDWKRVLGVSTGGLDIILAGDVMLGRSVMTKSLDMNDTTYPFKKVAATLKSADLVFINLENPAVSNCPRKYDGMTFCADPRMLDGLAFAGVDVVNLANNHILNYGNPGLAETKKFLEKAGISYVGVENLVIKEVEGVRFGFLGFNFVSKGPTESDLNLVKDSDLKVDVLIVGTHWGVEYQAKANSNQRKWAKSLVENGADVVAGHHPHWVQDSEYINNKPVYYSLGNFVFDQMWSQKTREGLAMRLVFNGFKLVHEEKLPIYMSSWAQPEFK